MTEQKTPDITLYTREASTGTRVSIVLEELGIPYKARRVSFETREQKEPWYLKIHPNGQVPAITDGDFSVFEAGAIALYLCEHYDPEGKLLPKDAKLRSQVIQWIMFSVSDLGPMQGQASFYLRYSPIEVPFAMKRYPGEAKRLLTVLNDALEGKDYLVGDTYTIADILSYPLVRAYFFYGIPTIDDLPNLKAWVARIDERPATQKGLNVPGPDKMKEFAENPEKLEEYSNNIKAGISKAWSELGQGNK